MPSSKGLLLLFYLPDASEARDFSIGLNEIIKEASLRCELVNFGTMEVPDDMTASRLDDEWWERELEALDEVEEEVVEWVQLLPVVDIQGLLNQGVRIKLEACLSVDELNMQAYQLHRDRIEADAASKIVATHIADFYSCMPIDTMSDSD